MPCSQYCLTIWLVKKLFPLPDGPRMNLFRLVTTPFFMGRSDMSRKTGFPVSRSTMRSPKGESEFR